MLVRVKWDRAAEAAAPLVSGRSQTAPGFVCRSISANHSRALRPHARDGLAGLLDRTDRHLSDDTAIPNHVLQALASQLALDCGEFLDRLSVRQLVHALEVAAPLLLAQREPVPRGILDGLGQNGAAAGDGFHVLLGLAGEALTVLTREAEGAGEPIRSLTSLMRSGLDALLHDLL